MQKTNFKTRLLALLTAVFMVVMCVPFAAFADDAFPVTIATEGKVTSIAYTGPWPAKMSVGDTFGLSSLGAKVEDGCTLQYKFTITKDTTNTDITVGGDVTDYKFGDEFKGAIAVTLTVQGIQKETTPDPKPETFQYTVQNTDGNGYVSILGEAQKQDYQLPVDTTELPLPADVKANDGYEFGGWTVYVSGANGADKISVPAGETSVDVSKYGKLNLAMASVVFNKVEAPAATKFEYYIQNTDKNGHVDVLGDAQVQHLTYDNGTETLPLPYEKITANDGYKFDGWKISVQPVEGSVKEFTVPAGTQSFSIKEYGELTLVGASAIFSKVETPVTYFDYTIQNASKNGKVAVLGDEQIQTVSLPSTTTVLDLPYEKITANDGYVFAGWTIYVQPKTGDADKFVVAAGTKSVDVSKYGELTLAGASAIFNKVDNFTFTIQNASKNGKVEVLGDEQIQSVELPVTTKELPLPYEKITANNGYVFAGWTIYVQPKNGNADKFVVKAGTKSVDVSKYGELSLAGASAIFEEKTAETFTYAIQNASKNGKVEVLGDEQLQSVELPVGTKELPLPYEKITANDGYVFAGWTIYVQPKNGNADKFTVAAGTKSVDVSKYGDLALAGASAIFEKKTDDKKDNSTSSSSSSNNSTSSSSSSSNKTTTASNEKQVVKAAAAPANTTKVLPKTGASNVAPLLGGSLAVVALLMGYGVYSLVLRKKD